MTVQNRIVEHLQKMRLADELNPYVHELLLARLDSLATHYDRHGSMEEAIRQEYSHFNMEPGYNGYGQYMIPLSQQEALDQFDHEGGIYLIYPNDAEGLCDDRAEIVSGQYHYAFEVNEPQSLLYLIEPEPPQAPKMVYIASPLRGDYNQNIQNAVTYCKNACDLGVLGLAPHIIFSQWCNDTIPEQREQGLKLGLSLLEKSEELWVMGEHISEGMRGEITFAKEHGIPTYYVSQPHDTEHYPISADKYPLLSHHSCMEGSMDTDLTGCLVVLQHEKLKPEHRKPINQLWLLTHGPGCRPGEDSRTVHLTHPVDGDRMCVGRFELCGVASPETIEQMKACYPQLAAMMQAEQAAEQGEELCR